MLINYKWLILIVTIGKMLLLTITGILPVVFWDKLFLLGLLCFMTGGVVFLLEKGVLNAVIHSFQLFFKNSSKLENYISKVEGKGNKDSSPFVKTSFSSVGFTLFNIGLFSLIVSFLFSFIFYY